MLILALAALLIPGALEESRSINRGHNGGWGLGYKRQWGGQAGPLGGHGKTNISGYTTLSSYGLGCQVLPGGLQQAMIGRNRGNAREKRYRWMRGSSKHNHGNEAVTSDRRSCVSSTSTSTTCSWPFG